MLPLATETRFLQTSLPAAARAFGANCHRSAESWRIALLLWPGERERVMTSIGGMFLLPAAMTYLACRFPVTNEALARRYVAAGLTVALGSAMLQTGAAILEDRFSGQLDLLRTCSVHKLSYYAARMGYGALRITLLIMGALGVATGVGYVDMTTTMIASSVVVSLIASASLCGLAAAIAVRAPTFDLGQSTLAVCSVGLALVSPLYYSDSALPIWLQPLLVLSPYTTLAPQMTALLSNLPLPLTSVLGAAALGALLHVVGYKGMDW